MKTFVVRWDYYDSQWIRYLLGPEDMTEKQFEDICLNLLPMVAQEINFAKNQCYADMCDVIDKLCDKLISTNSFKPDQPTMFGIWGEIRNHVENRKLSPDPRFQRFVDILHDKEAGDEN